MKEKESYKPNLLLELVVGVLMVGLLYISMCIFGD